MHSLKRGLTLAAVVAALAAPAAANAAITPNPYGTTAGTGRIGLSAPLANGACTLGNVAATATSTVTGATGTITGYTASACSGLIASASPSSPMSFTVSNGAVTLAFSILKRNILSGTCLYAGTLTGTMVSGSNTLSVSGTTMLVRALSGLCESTYRTSASITLPGAAITW